MRRSLAVVVALCGCSSPNTCDQHVAGDVVSMMMLHASAPSMGSAYDCAGGGTERAAFTGFGPNSIYRGTVTFAGCTETIDGDTLTLTGQVSIQGDTVNLPDNDHGMATQLAIHGSVAACGNVDETCDLDWGPRQNDSDPAFTRTGHLCGREFP